MKTRLTVTVRTDLPRHPHDARIMELARELRRLIGERASATKSMRNMDRVVSEDTRAAMSRAALARAA